MISKVLFVGALIGGLTYAFVNAQRQFNQQRALEKDDKSRWENEGGASKPRESKQQPLFR